METEELKQMYKEYIGSLVQSEGGTMDAMMEREPFGEWAAGVQTPSRWRKYGKCCFCELFTKDSTITCAGKPHMCKWFSTNQEHAD